MDGTGATANKARQPSNSRNSRNSRGNEEDLSERILRDMQKGDTLSALHPYQSTLTTRHLESAVVLENLAFSPALAASREKVRKKSPPIPSSLMPCPLQQSKLHFVY
jgi:hypothetical protein